LQSPTGSMYVVFHVLVSGVIAGRHHIFLTSLLTIRLADLARPYLCRLAR